LNLIGPGDFRRSRALMAWRETADATANTRLRDFVIDRREFIPFVRSQPALG